MCCLPSLFLKHLSGRYQTSKSLDIIVRRAIIIPYSVVHYTQSFTSVVKFEELIKSDLSKISEDNARNYKYFKYRPHH